MTGDAPRPGRPAPLIPPDRRRDAPLFCVVAILVFLACLSGLAALGAWRATEGWTAALEASATVQILTEEAGEADAEAEAAASVLADLPGVAAARALPRPEAEALLEPWFGTALPEELPAPRLIAVDLDPAAPAEMADLRAALDEAGIEAVLDDHGRWEAEIARASGLAQAASLTVVVLLTGAAGAVTVFAAQAGLAARREVISALRVAGAADWLIAWLFMRRFFLVGLGAGALAAALAGLAAGGLYFAMSGTGGLIALPEPGWGEALVLAAAPAAAAMIGALTAWATVMAELGRHA